MAFVLNTDSAPAWMKQAGFSEASLRCTELGGGVSNRVILAEAPGFRAVLKQSLGQLRVQHEWLSDPARIFREAEAMRWLAERVCYGRVPHVLREDREHFIICMEAAPPESIMWKTKLLAGECRSYNARAAGATLGSIIAASWNNPEASRLFGDQTVFQQLRLDPYYRFTASRHPSQRSYFENLMMKTRTRRVSLVHGDWSPKNLLVSDGALWAIDWEVVHFGDASFDVAFLVNHLLLKSIAMPSMHESLAWLAAEFLDALQAELPADAGWVESAALEHLPALLLARVDGKSPVEYLSEPGLERARELALTLMTRPASSLREVFAR